MKTVVLTGTGTNERKSNTLAVVKEVEKRIGGEFQIFNAYYMNIRTCNDCGFCHSNDTCARRDDMDIVYEALREADNVVIASPMYFGTLHPDLLKMISRLSYIFGQCYKQGKEHPFKRKNSMFIITAGQEWLNMFQACESIYPIINDHMNAKECGRIYLTKTNDHHITEQREIYDVIEEACKVFQLKAENQS